MCPMRTRSRRWLTWRCPTQVSHAQTWQWHLLPRDAVERGAGWEGPLVGPGQREAARLGWLALSPGAASSEGPEWVSSDQLTCQP